MAKIGDRFKTGGKCEASGSYVFDGFVDGSTGPGPTAAEMRIPLSEGETFPTASRKAAYWKLERFI